MNHEIGITIEEQIRLTDAGLWVCPTSPRPVVMGNLLIYSDPGHLTANFSAALASRTKKAIAATIVAPPAMRTNSRDP